jgi:hypothetical protein
MGTDDDGSAVNWIAITDDSNLLAVTPLSSGAIGPIGEPLLRR